MTCVCVCMCVCARTHARMCVKERLYNDEFENNIDWEWNAHTHTQTETPYEAESRDVDILMSHYEICPLWSWLMKGLSMKRFTSQALCMKDSLMSAQITRGSTNVSLSPRDRGFSGSSCIHCWPLLNKAQVCVSHAETGHARGALNCSYLFLKRCILISPSVHV